MRPTLRKVSPNLFISRAYRADLTAEILVNQKEIRRYEATPMNSQPTNITR